MDKNDTTIARAYPRGALLRVGDICRTSKGPGLLPIVPRTWHKWVAAGTVPKGIKLGPKTTAWRVEDVMALADQGGQVKPAA